MGMIEKTYTVFAVVILFVGIVFSLGRVAVEEPDPIEMQIQKQVDILEDKVDYLENRVEDTK